MVYLCPAVSVPLRIKVCIRAITLCKLYMQPQHFIPAIVKWWELLKRDTTLIDSRWEGGQQRKGELIARLCRGVCFFKSMTFSSKFIFALLYKEIIIQSDEINTCYEGYFCADMKLIFTLIFVRAQFPSI